MTKPINDDETRIKVRDLLEKTRFVMLVTTDASGSMQSRPMTILAIEDQTVWFFTDVNSPKTLEIGRDHEVLLASADPSGQSFVSATGTARVTQDVEKQKALWSEANRLWFPKGPESENLALIAVTLQGAEYWDSPASTALFAYGYVKAVVAGKPPTTGENETVTFART
ncbi:MAG: ral stress protein [Rubritepida sp.]|nr:ral stress protein [Rubritepida sp.]